MQEILETLAELAESSGVKAFDISDANGGQVYISGLFLAIEDLQEDFAIQYDLLSTGSYYIRAKKVPKDYKGAVKFAFTKGPKPRINNLQTKPKQDTMTSVELEALLSKAREDGRMQAHYEAMIAKQEVHERRLNELEKKLDKVINALEKLLDEAEDNDQQAKDMISTAASTIMERAASKISL